MNASSRACGLGSARSIAAPIAWKKASVVMSKAYAMRSSNSTKWSRIEPQGHSRLRRDLAHRDPGAAVLQDTPQHRLAEVTAPIGSGRSRPECLVTRRSSLGRCFAAVLGLCFALSQRVSLPLIRSRLKGAIALGSCALCKDSERWWPRLPDATIHTYRFSQRGGRVLFVQKVAVSLLHRTSARPKLLIRRAAQRSARLEIGTCRGS